MEERDSHNLAYVELRDRLISIVSEEITHARLTGHPTDRLPNHASFVFRDIDGNQLLAALDLSGYACSSGSACKTGDPEPSKVLIALGFDRPWGLGSLRITVGRHTKSYDIEGLLKVLPDVISRLRTAQDKEA